MKEVFLQMQTPQPGEDVTCLRGAAGKWPARIGIQRQTALVRCLIPSLWLCCRLPFWLPLSVATVCHGEGRREGDRLACVCGVDPVCGSQCIGNVVIEKLINQMYGDGYQTWPPTQICQGWQATGKCGMSEGASLTSRGSLRFQQKEGSLSRSVAAPQLPLLQGAKAWGPSCSSDRHLVRPLCPAVL